MLQLQTVQKASLLGMEGSRGKQSFGRDSHTAIPAFARTASHVLRMVMLEACGVEPQYWPSGGDCEHGYDIMPFYYFHLVQRLAMV